MNVKSLHLIVPNATHKNLVMQYRDAFLDVHPGHIPGAPSLAKCDTYDHWLRLLELDQNNIDPYRVAASQYIALDDSEHIIGVIQLRHALTPYLMEVGGHIGYSVHPFEEGKGYATEMLRLCLDKAREIGLERVLVTCDKDNVGSSRVIEKNGGVLEDIRDTPDCLKRRYWITING